jgi:glutathione S-transferase
MNDESRKREREIPGIFFSTKKKKKVDFVFVVFLTMEQIKKEIEEFGGCDFIAVTEACGGVKLGLTEARHTQIEEEKSDRKASFGVEQTVKLAALLTKLLAEHDEAWLAADLDTEICFQSEGNAQVYVPNKYLDVDNSGNVVNAASSSSAAASSSSSSSSSSASSSSSFSSSASCSVGVGANRPFVRYWAVRGRVEAIRLMLADALGADGVDYDDIAFTDDNVAAWRTEKKADASFSGPFHTLPVVRWGGDGALVGETEAAARYLAGMLGLDAARNPAKRALADSIACAVYQAVTCTCMKPLYAKGCEAVAAEIETLRTSYAQFLPMLADILGDSDYFVEAHRPLYADYFVLDALQQVFHVLGNNYLEQFATLAAFRQRMEQRPNIAKHVPNQFKKWCASPHEDESWAIVRELQNQ